MAKQRNRREATFLEHLEELRQRVIRSFLYVVAGTAVCWSARKALMSLALAPLIEAGRIAGVGEVGVKLFGIAEGFLMSLNIAMVGGIILSAPFWLMELWLFVEPALEDHERKWVVPLLPGAVFLFLSGVFFCYWLSPRAFAILLKFQHDLGAAPELMLPSYLSFFLRLVLIFGAMFELPLVVMFLAAVGIVKSSWLLRFWRQAVIVIAVIAAVVTPTPDAVTMSLLCGPLIGLYFLSIGLAKMVEKKRDKPEAEEPAVEATAWPAASTAPEPDPYAAYRTDHLAEAEAPAETSTPEDPLALLPPPEAGHHEDGGEADEGSREPGTDD
jgi:sec-independent protein translocase protein TatC